jgi:hypothetical protein
MYKDLLPDASRSATIKNELSLAATDNFQNKALFVAPYDQSQSGWATQNLTAALHNADR